jgi:hypothetical protein
MLRHWPESGRDAKPIDAAGLNELGAVGGSCIYLDEQAVVVLDRSGELRQVHLDLAATVAMNTLLKARIKAFTEEFLGPLHLIDTGGPGEEDSSGGDAESGGQGRSWDESR